MVNKYIVTSFHNEPEMLYVADSHKEAVKWITQYIHLCKTIHEIEYESHLFEIDEVTNMTPRELIETY